MGLLSMFIIVASSAGLCLIHGIFESSYQFSYTTGKSLEAVSEETEEEAMQSRYTMVIGALQIAGFVGAQGMSGVVGRWLGSARAVLLFGAVLSSGGLLTAGYTGELWQLCLTQGAVVGIGCGVSYGAAIGAFVRLMDAKKQRITLACGAMATGIGGSVLAFVVQRIFLVCGQNTSVTLRWLALLIGGLQAVSILFAGSKWHSTNEPPQNCSGHIAVFAGAFDMESLAARIEKLGNDKHLLHSAWSAIWSDAAEFDQSYFAAAVAEYANLVTPGSYVVQWQEGSSVRPNDKTCTASLLVSGEEDLDGENAAVEEIVRKLGPAVVTDECARWVRFASERLGASKNFKDLDAALMELDHHLVMRSLVSGYAVSVADAAVWGALRSSAIFQRNLKTKREMLGDHVVRWYTHIDSLPFIVCVGETLAQQQQERKKAANSAAAAAATSADQGSFDLGLEGVEYGKVVTRFPPEPSGFLHIGHAKAALLNQYFAHQYGGKMIVRFDDTNPTKEKGEFEDSITEDLRLLGIAADEATHTSDYFQTIYEYALKIIQKGLAYVDDTDQLTMRTERGDGVASRCRDLSVEDNLARFQEMKDGTEFGQTCCLRAKMSVDNPNKSMRDPVIYRCNLTPHHRTGSQWKIYPTYDFCCPIVDSLEGVTHALRSMEYRDRNPQYEWFFPALDLRPVAIKDFSRMNFVYTLLSKRKLQWFVDQGRVTGWDDPRFPTVRGIRRRGMTIDALRQYVLMQGASQKNMLLEWDKIWAVNKKVIDPVAPRHTVLLKKDLVPVSLPNGPSAPYVADVPKHKKNPELGTKQTVFSAQIFVNQADAAAFEAGEEVTLMDWGNAFVEAVEKSNGAVTNVVMKLHLEGDVKATKKKITWLGQHPSNHPVEAMLVDYDYLITKKKIDDGDDIEDVLTPTTEFVEPAIADANVGRLPRGAIIQFERVGYYIVDKIAGESELGLVTLIRIPDGKAATMASKHKEDPVSAAAGAKKAAAGKKAKGSPWDKGNASKSKKQSSADAGSSVTLANDKKLGLPAHENVTSMYKTAHVYGDVPLQAPENVTKMYETPKHY
ncbi:glutamate--tRNA ligase [Coemansia sp. RSA 1813]|nr:glutamate--tRNA ligase [Coemansia sp. RSA 1813]